MKEERKRREGPRFSAELRQARLSFYLATKSRGPHGPGEGEEMYDDLAHTGVGAAVLTVVAAALSLIGFLAKKLGRNTR